MSELLPDQLQPVIWGVTFFLACSYFGDLIDKKIRAEYRTKLYHAMANTFERTSRIEFFIEMFDGLFNPADAWRPRFWRSSLASVTIFCILFLMWALSNFGIVFGETSPPVLLLLLVLIFGIPINIIGDYFSLWETRYVLGKMATATGNVQRVFLFTIDIIASVFVYLAGFLGGTYCTWIVLGWIFGIQSLEDTVAFVVDILSELFLAGIFLSHSSMYMNLFGIFFLTSLFTSLWLWSFLLGLAGWPLFSRFNLWFDVRQNPAWTAMTIGGMVMGLAIMVIGFVVS